MLLPAAEKSDCYVPSAPGIGFRARACPRAKYLACPPGLFIMRVSTRRILLWGALLAVPSVVAAETRPAVVELYTSQGCSSCPPAEAYIGELAQRRGVLALSFHVDYWDHLGWPDHYALPDAVTRQRGYARVLGNSSVYTPQVVIDGHGDFVGSDRRAIDFALAEPRATVVPIELGASQGEVTIRLPRRDGIAPSEVLFVAYQRQVLSQIARGENAGRTLTQFNVVRSLRTLGQWNGGARLFRASVETLPPGTTDVAVLLQPVGLGPIIGAAMLPLPRG